MFLKNLWKGMNFLLFLSFWRRNRRRQTNEWSELRVIRRELGLLLNMRRRALRNNTFEKVR